jgi:DNA-binding SARP family transcriptional activator
MSLINIRMLGRFSIDAERSIGAFDTGKTKSLLCYLLLYKDKAHLRETLASRLWEDATTAQTKKHLRQILWHLQSILGDQHIPTDRRILIVDSEWVQVNPGAALWLDADVFTKAHCLVQGKAGETLEEWQARHLQEAIDLYRGDLLEGCYEDWCLFERERLQNMMLTMLDKLMGYCEVNQEYESGVQYGERTLCYDRASEHTYRRLMRLHYLNGERTAALRQYQRCKAALREELDVQPSTQTELLYEQIKADYAEAISQRIIAFAGMPRLHEAEPLAAKAANSTPSAPSLGKLGSFQQLEASLTTLEQQILVTIQTLRATRSDGHNESR